MLDDMRMKIGVAVNMIFVHTHYRRANANAAYAINNSSLVRIAIAMQNFDAVYKDSIQVIILFWIFI